MGRVDQFLRVVASSVLLSACALDAEATGRLEPQATPGDAAESAAPDGGATDGQVDSDARSKPVKASGDAASDELGDGVFDVADYLAAGGRFGVGTDANIQIDAAAELRQLEYEQRLARSARNVMAMQEGESTGRRLFVTALAGGSQALQQPIGGLAAGLRADIVVLDEGHPDLASRYGDELLDAWTFVAGRTAVKTVLVGGEIVVEAGRHRMWPAIEERYKVVIANLFAE